MLPPNSARFIFMVLWKKPKKKISSVVFTIIFLPDTQRAFSQQNKCPVAEHRDSKLKIPLDSQCSFLGNKDTPPPSPFALNILLFFLSMMLLLLLLSHFSRVQLCDPRDGSPPGSPIPGILQARTLEWVAISFSNAGKWKVKVKPLSCVRLLETPWTAAYQAPPNSSLKNNNLTDNNQVGYSYLCCFCVSVFIYIINMLRSEIIWLSA